ncbi:helix-turn-helix domain-containing protein [Paenibacillus xanthanilyticus]|uniref:AraC family transcriptional regulator n=1 Tax=Paenibacillus xanthanilyticus TaxID=1783531 RepID=A0ABV8K9H6_9BACL
MDYMYFNGFTPRIIEVANRNKQVWEQLNGGIDRERTGLHSLAYVYGGEGSLSFAGQEQLLVQGDLFQIWPGEMMSLRSSPADPLHFYSFQFQHGLVQWDGGSISCREQPGPLPLQLGNAGAARKAVESVFREAYELWSEKNNGYEWHVKLQLLHAIQLLNRLGRSSAETAGAASVVHNAIQLMKTSFKEALTRDQMADSVALSPGYFSVLFKAHTGHSPIQYLTKIRIDQAKLLLRNTTLAISQVAEESGFPDSFYFSRLFQKETGMSPRDYRKS